MDTIIEIDYVSELVVEFLSFLAKLAYDNSYWAYFTNSYKNIIYYICLPLLQINSNELDSLNMTP